MINKLGLHPILLTESYTMEAAVIRTIPFVRRAPCIKKVAFISD